MEVVVILGAGASAGFGVPTLRQLFKDAEARKYLAKNVSIRETLEKIAWLPRGLTLEQSHLGLTVEEILTLVRDSERQDYGLPEILTRAERVEFQKGLYLLIKRAIYDGKSSEKGCLNPLLQFMRKRASHVTWASFNWDCLFESSFYYSSAAPYEQRVNPELAIPVSGWDRVQTSKHVFLKLHGGINWWYDEGKVRYLPFGRSDQLNEHWTAYETTGVSGEPVILEPSYYKYSGAIYELLRPQWLTFASALAKADLVFVVGYSLPEPDAEARSAITLGFQANPGARWIVLDPADSVRRRYQQILGTSRLIELPGTLDEWNDDLELVVGELLEAG
jgi:hypothetical protein